ncbi:MAG: TolC family protein, partial [Candidatus Muiribacteriaceae bacterium]
GESLTKRFSGDSLFENESWSAGLSYSLNLFDGNRRDETLKGYDLNIQRTEKNLKTRINNIRRAVFSAISDYSLSLKKLDIDKRVLKSKKDIYSLTKLQYEQGTASYFNLQQKEADLTNAETSYINSLFNLRNNLAKLQYNIGRSTL